MTQPISNARVPSATAGTQMSMGIAASASAMPMGPSPTASPSNAGAAACSKDPAIGLESSADFTLLPLPPAFPTTDIVNGTVPETSMPPNVVSYVKAQLLGEQHARWHTTRDFLFTMQELSQVTPATGGDVLKAWDDLRAAHLGLPAPNPPPGTPVDPKQTAFITAMKAFVAANANSTDPSIQDVVNTWNQIQSENWSIPARQEGDPGNGLDFLTMHHEMILTMKNTFAQDPAVTAILKGWREYPTPAPWPYDAKTSAPGVAKATTAANLMNEMLAADTPSLVAKFKTDFKTVTGLDFDSATPDQFGQWIQSSAAGLPHSGLHNWMHNQYEVPNSSVEMDSFVLNVQNPHFWGLHGTIDNCFMKFLSLRGISVNDPAIKADLAEQAAEMGMQVQPEPGSSDFGSRCPTLKLGVDGSAVLADGAKITPFDKASASFKEMLKHTQALEFQAGMG
jgi:hypothetical protein